METLQENPDGIRKLAEAKRHSLGLGLNLKLGSENKIQNTEEINRTIEKIRATLDEFEKAQQNYQDTLDKLTNSIFITP